MALDLCSVPTWPQLTSEWDMERWGGGGWAGRRGAHGGIMARKEVAGCQQTKLFSLALLLWFLLNLSHTSI